MGNTVSAAEIAQKTATQFINPDDSIQKHKHKFKDFKGEIPEECPMHQKKSTSTMKDSGCPVGGGEEEINPLNMVKI